jgi:hypothetical protein
MRIRLPDDHRISRARVLAVVVPLGACPVWWLWRSVATSHRECATGSGSSTATGLVFLGLIVITPVVILVDARQRGSIREAVKAAVLGTLFAIVALYITGVYWWADHDCMT